MAGYDPGFHYREGAIRSDDGKISIKVGDVVYVVKEPTHHREAKTSNKLEVGQAYRVAHLYSDPTLLLHPLDDSCPRIEHAQAWYCDPSCVDKYGPVTDEEMDAVMKSLGVRDG